MRVRGQPVDVDADELKQFTAAGTAPRAGAARLMVDEDVLQLATDVQHGIERVHGALEDHRNLLPPEQPQRLAVQPEHVNRLAAGC